MNFREDIRSVTDLKIRPAELLETVNKNHRPMVITQNGEAKAIVQDIASYEATQKALLLLKLAAQGEADIRHKKTSKQSDVFALLIEKKLKSRG